MLSSNGNRVIWAVVIVALALLAFRTRNAVETYFATVGRLDLEDGDGRTEVFLRWTGKIEADGQPHRRGLSQAQR